MDTNVVEEEAVAIRGYELRLIRCTLNSEQPQQVCALQKRDSLDDSIKHLLNLIQCGSYIQALTSKPSFHLVFRLAALDSPPLSDPDHLYPLLVDRAECFITAAASDAVEQRRRGMLVTCIAVAAFLGFTQANFTGPLKGAELPRCPLRLDGDDEERDNWARNELISAGSDLVGKFSNLQYIVFAKMLLIRVKDLGVEMKSLWWWLARVLVVQQRVLNERCSSLSDLLHLYMGEALQTFGCREQVESYWQDDLHDGESSDIVSVIHLEAGIIEYVYGRVDSCRMHFKSAEMAAGLQLSLTGVLGFRTEHQVEPKAQMVLVTNTGSSNNVDENCPLTNTGIQTCDSNKGEDDWNLNQHEASEASPVLRIPKLLENNDENGGHVTATLTATQQAVILAFCILIEIKISPHRDELQLWEMAPYIEAIDSQNFFYFTIRCLSDFLRIRWESSDSRPRTQQRALLMMDNLVKHIYEPSPAIADRIAFSYAVYMPSIPELKKKYGSLLKECHLIGEAAKEFEELELWYNLIECYSSMGKKAEAVELIKKRLLETPNDPSLWCSLGDITENDACFEKALEVSNNRSYTAKRSMAKSAYKRGDYYTSIILWDSAIAMNSMDSEGWFGLGKAALKAPETGKALDAFTRVIQLDPENENAWNNIACLQTMKKRGKEAFITLKEALKFKQNSLHLWERYSLVAVEIGNISQALEGVQTMLDISNNKKVDSELLERITGEVEKRVLASVGGRSRETEQLLVLLGKVLQQIVKYGSGFESDIWGLYAKWHKMNGDLMMSSEALLKQVRSLQGSDTWKDQDRFKKFAKSSLDLCQVYMDMFSSSSGSSKQLSTAELHLKNAQSCFSDTQEFRDLQACYDEVKIKLQSNSINA
ncbi:superkiller protein 3 [Vigna unguiculata]|uniref:Superkiller protein 3 n=1 Tax=Vigna unguiculata TaxID=3917 RepID=A0A4D6NII3_VIGUN|nr:superkiller protein 3 [Vigna unguiculata]